MSLCESLSLSWLNQIERVDANHIFKANDTIFVGPLTDGDFAVAKVDAIALVLPFFSGLAYHFTVEGAGVVGKEKTLARHGFLCVGSRVGYDKTSICRT